MQYFFKHLLYSGTWFRQTKCIMIIAEKGSTEIVNVKLLMTPMLGVFVLGHGHIKSYCENAIFLLLFLSTLGHQTK